MKRNISRWNSRLVVALSVVVIALCLFPVIALTQQGSGDAPPQLMAIMPHQGGLIQGHGTYVAGVFAMARSSQAREGGHNSGWDVAITIYNAQMYPVMKRGIPSLTDVADQMQRSLERSRPLDSPEAPIPVLKKTATSVGYTTTTPFCGGEFTGLVAHGYYTLKVENAPTCEEIEAFAKRVAAVAAELDNNVYKSAPGN